MDRHPATGGAKGLEFRATRGPFAGIAFDVCTTAMADAPFLARVRERNPGIVRIILSGPPDLEDAFPAASEGRSVRSPRKSCSADRLWQVLESALERHRLMTVERDLLEQSPAGSVRMRIEILGRVSPSTQGRASSCSPRS